MTTKNYSIQMATSMPRVLGAVAAVFFAASVQAQQVSTVISSGLLDPNYVTADPNNDIFFTDSSDNRVVEFVPTTNGVLTFAGLSGTGNTGNANGTGSAARFNQPTGIVYDPYRGGLIVVDQLNQALRFVSLGGVVSNLAGIQPIYIGNTVLSPSSGGPANGPALKAQFSAYMMAIATDGSSNIYIADAGSNVIRCLDTNNMIETIQVTNYTFNQPSGLVVDNNNNLWVADTKNDTICVISNISMISNLSATVIAGTLRTPGTNDSLTAASALFYQPSGLLWDPNGAGLFISDTANQTIRRLWANAAVGGAYSVQTVSGQPGVAGSASGALNIATFDYPVGLGVDALNEGYYVVDRANNSLRRLQPTAPQPPVSDPSIGYVTFITPTGGGTPLSVFNPATNETFNNPAIIAVRAETGVQTYMTFGPTPVSPYLNTIPSPGPTTGTSPEIYAGDGNSASETLPSVLPPQPDVTMYVISEAPGRGASDIATARFRFVTANPQIGGNNAESVTLTDNTAGATMWYTLNGSVPNTGGTNGSIGPITNGTTISFDPITNTTLTVDAFAPNFSPSGNVVEVFSPSNFVANEMTFGFASGEASSEFVGSAGARFYAPITLTLLPGATMYSMQFNVTVTNLPVGSPLNPGLSPRFNSMLVYPTNINGATYYLTIPPAMFTNGGLQTLLFTNTSENLLGVGWLEIVNQTNLYPANSQDLITYSLAHETLFAKSGGQVVIGSYSFQIPTNSPINSQYQIQIGRPSADADGFAENALILTATNGSLGAGAANSTKIVSVAVTPYLVGDAAPFRWFNAGDFGDSNLLNNDVLEVFRAAVYFLNRPLPNSDFADAYDSADGTYNGLFNGDDTLINNISKGDGVLDVSDVYVTYRRSLDPALWWWERYWSNGVQYAQRVPNTTPTVLTTIADATTTTTSLHGGAPRYITVGADRVQGSAGQTVQIPVRVLAADSLPLKVLMLNVDVDPLDGSPDVTNTVTFTPSSGIGAPTVSLSQGVENYSGAWLVTSNSGIVGTSVIGTVSVTLPPNATANSSYLVHFEHFSASPNGLATYHTTIQDGLVTVGSDRTASSWNDGIPDWWRLMYFGTVSNLLSAGNLDPDGDGASNWQEYVAGTNPMDSTSVLQVGTTPNVTPFVVQWPSVVGKSYILESSSSLFSTNWTVISSNMPGTGQMMQLSDTNPPAPPARFYRVQAQ